MLELQNDYLAFARRSGRRLPPPRAQEWSWRSRGRCQGFAPELFFPEDERQPHRRLYEEAAKRICRDCPVIAQCRDHALNAPEGYGVWGAMTARERARAYSPPLSGHDSVVSA